MEFFVYGTLKRGFPNARCIPTEHIQSVVPASLKGFNMYSAGGFPAIVRGDGVVQGELITLKDDAPAQDILKRVDRLEGEGRMYKRESLNVLDVSAQEPQEAYVYVWLYSLDGLKRVLNNTWE